MLWAEPLAWWKANPSALLRRSIEPEQPAGAETCAHGAEYHRRVPAFPQAVVAGKTQARVQLGAHRKRQQEIRPEIPPRSSAAASSAGSVTQLVCTRAGSC